MAHEQEGYSVDPCDHRRGEELQKIAHVLPDTMDRKVDQNRPVKSELTL